MPVEIRPLDKHVEAETVRFIRSWSSDDVYARFGSAGINGGEFLATQLSQRLRTAFVAVDGNEVIGLLDHVTDGGVTHFGIVVDRRFRRKCIGTALVRTFLASTRIARAVLAECARHNFAGLALLRGCRFRLTGRDAYDVAWRYE